MGDNKNLYEKQKDTLDKFLERNAITKEQYGVNDLVREDEN